MVIDEGRIVALVPDRELTNFEPTQLVECLEHAVMPGLVNAHTHAAMSLFRGLADDLPLMEWLQQHVWPAEARHMSEDFVRLGTELAICEMLLSGTTCFNDMYFFPDVAGKVAEAVGIRAVVGLIVIDSPTVWAQDLDEYLARATTVHDEFRGSQRITTAFAPHAPYTVSDHGLRRIGVLAEELDIPIHIHLHETANEVKSALASYGHRPLARLHELGLLSPRLIAVHMTELEESEIISLAEHAVSVIHCPESNMKLASGRCPVATLLRAGVNVALGTDGAASNNDLDMLGEMRTAALLGKAVSGDAAALPAATALHMATLGGARALGLGAEIGSLEPGKQADLIAVDLSAPATQPLYNPISQIVYAASRDAVTDVWVGGHAVVRSRQVLQVNAARVLDEARAFARDLQARDG